jgi:hypothetical protein
MNKLTLVISAVTLGLLMWRDAHWTHWYNDLDQQVGILCNKLGVDS